MGMDGWIWDEMGVDGYGWVWMDGYGMRWGWMDGYGMRWDEMGMDGCGWVWMGMDGWMDGDGSVPMRRPRPSTVANRSPSSRIHGSKPIPPVQTHPFQSPMPRWDEPNRTEPVQTSLWIRPIEPVWDRVSPIDGMGLERDVCPGRKGEGSNRNPSVGTGGGWEGRRLDGIGTDKDRTAARHTDPHTASRLAPSFPVHRVPIHTWRGAVDPPFPSPPLSDVEKKLPSGDPVPPPLAPEHPGGGGERHQPRGEPSTFPPPPPPLATSGSDRCPARDPASRSTVEGASEGPRGCPISVRGAPRVASDART
eukprot:scaffold684_cov345-Pavlova_lutheri.AAC.72